ncbi:MAG: hypothetical protein AAFY88_03165 [Acidobacteriota bacterium]
MKKSPLAPWSKSTAVLGALALVLTLCVALPAQAESFKVINAFEVDDTGSVVNSFDLKVDGKSTVIGDELPMGTILNNDGNNALVITFSSGDVGVIDASSSRLMVATQRRECRCNCGPTRFTFPPTTQTACEALDGQTCENPAGTVRRLRDCGLTWVSTAAVTLAQYTMEAGKAVPLLLPR